MCGRKREWGGGKVKEKTITVKEDLLREADCKTQERKRRQENLEASAGGLVLIQHFNKSMPLEEHNLHPELS